MKDYHFEGLFQIISKIDIIDGIDFEKRMDSVTDAIYLKRNVQKLARTNFRLD
jgi:hypothetical protein